MVQCPSVKVSEVRAEIPTDLTGDARQRQRQRERAKLKVLIEAKVRGTAVAARTSGEAMKAEMIRCDGDRGGDGSRGDEAGAAIEAAGVAIRAEVM